jgi:hypothetical protein
MHSLENCSVSPKVELSASAGGPGQKVIWDLSDAAKATYTANVEVNDGSGLTASDSTTVAVALCHDCVTRESPCPTVAVSCPENAKSNQSMTFEAHVYGGDPTIKVNLHMVRERRPD